jgi:hypothetical protein
MILEKAINNQETRLLNLTRVFQEHTSDANTGKTNYQPSFAEECLYETYGSSLSLVCLAKTQIMLAETNKDRLDLSERKELEELILTQEEWQIKFREYIKAKAEKDYHASF